MPCDKICEVKMWNKAFAPIAARGYRLVWSTTSNVAATCLLALTFIVTFSVFMRYVLRNPQYWPSEISGYLLLAVVFLGFAYAQERRAHIRVDFVFEHLPKPLQRIVTPITTLMALGYTVIFAWKSWENAWMSLTHNFVSMTTLAVPLFIPQVVMPIGLIALAVTLIGSLGDE
jgi:C4-dicarboxylate transporter DctQ subunit